MQSILVTGGAGFIGSHLIRFLLQQPDVGQVINLDKLQYAATPSNLSDVQHHPRYHFIQGDICDQPLVQSLLKKFQVTRVAHLAAESHVDRSIQAPADFIQTNIVGAFSMLEACRQVWTDASDCKFLHVSTDEVYGSLGPIGFFDEQSLLAPNSPYAASKASSDLLVRSYFRTYGFPAVTTRCSNNYGPGQHREKFIPTVMESILRRKPIPVYGDGLQVRDWLYVEDHVQALWSVLQRGRVGETYNIGANNEWTNIKLVEQICDLMDESYPQLGGSRKLISFVQDRPGHDRRYALSVDKLKKELSWEPRVSFEEGLRRTVRGKGA